MLRRQYATAASTIAADRNSRLLPSFASTVVFVFQVFASFWKTLNALGDTYDEDNLVSKGLNRTPHNIAFGTLFFWLPVPILLIALVGTPTRRQSVPLALYDLVNGAGTTRHPNQPNVRGTVRSNEAGLDPDGGHSTARGLPSQGFISRRRNQGGMPLWQPGKFPTRNGSTSWSQFLVLTLVGIAMVSVPTMCAVRISYMTPTDGFGCRAVTQLSFLLIWVLSAWCDLIWARSLSDRDPDSKFLFRRVLCKDIVVTALTIVVLSLTATGIFNKCFCWSTFGSKYISFLQQDYIFNLIKHRMFHLYPALVGTTLTGEALLSIAIALRYGWTSWGVLTQPNIHAFLLEMRERSNPGYYRASWWHRCRRRCRRIVRAVRCFVGHPMRFTRKTMANWKTTAHSPASEIEKGAVVGRQGLEILPPIKGDQVEVRPEDDTARARAIARQLQVQLGLDAICVCND